jgi:hypothetical protein
MRRRRKRFVILISLAASMIVVGVGAFYHVVTKNQRHAAAALILHARRMFSPGPNVGGPAVILESKRREIYGRAIIAAEKIAVLDEKKRHDGVTPVEDYETSLSEAVGLAIRRIALGNAISEGDVLQIVREGSANDW